MDKNALRFSVLIPCYNYAHFLGECLQSVMEQTIGAWEAIVVDDASTQGNAGAEIAKFPDPRIRFFRHEHNLGAGTTFNTAFNHSRYPYLFLLSADDKLSPHFLEYIRTVLLEKPAVDVVTVNLQLFGDNDGVWEYPVRDAYAMTQRQWIPGPASVLKRCVWEKAGGYYEGPELKSGNLDWDFWLSVMKQGPEVIHIPRALYQYRVHGNSITSKRADDDHKIHEFMYQRHRELFDRFGAGGGFRALGCLNSAVASWQKGERLRAAELAQRAWILHPVEDDVFNAIRKEFENNNTDIGAVRMEMEQKIAYSPDYGLSPAKENVFMYRDLARLSAAQQDWRAAEMFLLHALAFLKNPVTAANLCNLLGLVYMKLGDPVLAAQAFDLTLHYCPTNRGVFLHRANLFLSIGLWREALRACVEGLWVLPSNRSLIALLGKISAQRVEKGWNEKEFNGILETASEVLPEPLASDLLNKATRSFLYGSPLGRKIYWISRAKDLFDKYGRSDGGFDTLGNAIAFVSPARILEIGCGNGRNFPLYDMMKIGEVVGQDISTSALELAKKRGFHAIRLMETPISELTFPENYFDLAVSNRVLQHIPPQDVGMAAAAVCRMARYIYINEATPEEMGNSCEPFYMFIHDYPALFGKHGFVILREMKADNQRRFVFGRNSHEQ